MVARDYRLHAEDSIGLVATFVDTRRASFSDLDTYGRLPCGESRDAKAPESSLT